MKVYSNPLHWRELVIAGLIGVLFILFGSVYDLKIAQAVYDPALTSAFGILFSGLGEWPCYLLLVFAGAGLIGARRKKSKVALTFCYIIGILAIALGMFLAWRTFQNISEFHITNTGGWALFTQLFGLAFILVLAIPIIVSTIKHASLFDKEVLFRISFLLLIIIGCELIGFNGLKFLWSRPRPRSFITLESVDVTSFHPFWQLEPFAALKKDNCTSFPSGHTANAAVTMIGLPLLISLFPKTREKTWLRLVGFYLGLLWAIIVAVSRLYAGAHFLSDTGAGLLVTVIISAIVLFVDFAKDKKIELKEK